MNIAVIVVDAWKNHDHVPQDLINYPFLKEEVKTYSAYLNHMLNQIRKKPQYTIYHNATGKEIIDEIDTSQDTIVNDAEMMSMPEFSYYMFCGFHISRCIKRKMQLLNRKNCGVVLNMSMVYPKDPYCDRLSLFVDDTFMYSHANGFEPMAINNINTSLRTNYGNIDKSIKIVRENKIKIIQALLEK
jgi:hypothetical protein